MWMLSVLALSVTALLCIAGTLAHTYNDNLIQRLGMSGLAYGATARAVGVLHSQQVNNDWLIVHVSICLFAIGTAIKVWQHRRSGKRF